jgi:hypothetical protein
MDRRLIVVSRSQPELWQRLKQHYAHVQGVDIILDRRQWQGWTRPRQDADHQSPSRSDMELQNQGFLIIPRP